MDLTQIPLAGQGSSSVGYRIDGWSGGDHFGASLATGDINGDGVGDIVVGDPDASPFGRSQAGNVYVIYGQTGTSQSEIDVSQMNTSQGKLISGWAAGDRTGTSVAVGPFNTGAANGSCQTGASGESIAIGAPGAGPNGQNQEGEVYVIYSEALGGSSIDLSHMTSQTGYLIEGHWAGDRLGQAVADGGNVNQDCNHAILIGDPTANPNGMWQAGSVFVAYGRPQNSQAGNEDVSTLQQYGQGYRIDGPGTGDHYGTSVANAGDIDGDGIPDVIAGAPGFDYGAGEAIVTYGQNRNTATGINTTSLSNSGNPFYGYAIEGYTPDYSQNGTEGTEVPWVPNTQPGQWGTYSTTAPQNVCQWFTAGAVKQGSYPNATSVTAEGDRAGATVAGLGDVNNDTVPDVLVGTPGWNDSAGAVQVIYGHRGRTQGNIALYANGSGLAPSVGTTIWDGNTPPPSHPSANRTVLVTHRPPQGRSPGNSSSRPRKPNPTSVPIRGALARPTGGCTAPTTCGSPATKPAARRLPPRPGPEATP